MSGPHLFRCRVYHEDVDLGGVVYHAGHLRFLERARTEWARGLGVDQMALLREGVAIVVRRMEADWLRPARWGDDLVVETEPEDAGPARAVLRQRVRREGEAAPLFAARVTLAALGPRGRPVRLPAALRGSA